MTMLGASVEDLNSFAATLTSNAGKIEATTRQLSAGLRTAWAGPDGDEFRSLWSQQLEPSLFRAAMSLSESAQRIRTQAREQEDTSNTDGGTAVSFGAGSLPKDLLTSGLGLAGLEAATALSGGGTVLGALLPGVKGFIDAPWASIRDQTKEISSNLSKYGKYAGKISTVTGKISEIAGDIAPILEKEMPRVSQFMDRASTVLGDTSEVLDDVSKSLRNAGKFFSYASMFADGMSAVQEISHGDYYGGADHLISAGLTAGSLIPGPVGTTCMVLGVGWSVAQHLSGDVPVSKRIVDGAGQALDTARHAVDEVGKAANETGKAISNTWNSLWNWGK